MKTMADENSSNPNVGALVFAVATLSVGVLCLAMILAFIKPPQPALGYMAPLVSKSFCPKVGEKFGVTVKGINATAVTDGHSLKLIKTEPEPHFGMTNFIFLPIAEGLVKIHLTSAGYWPETIERRVSRFTEDAWSIADKDRKIEIQRNVWLKSDDYGQLWFDNELVGGTYTADHFLFVADLIGNSNDKESPVWTTSPNMKVDNERTRGNEFLEMGLHGYRFTTRVWVASVPNTPDSGWVRISWKGLWRTITIPDPHPAH